MLREYFGLKCMQQLYEIGESYDSKLAVNENECIDV